MAKLSQEQVRQLERQGCTSDSWGTAMIDPACDLSRFRNVEFVGTVTVGPNTGEVTVDGIGRPCGIYDATLIDSTVEGNVRIAGIGSAISGYEVREGAVIEDVDACVADEGATFGNGTEIETVNEAGGRIVILHSELSAQTAFLQAFRRHDAGLQHRLSVLSKEAAAASTPERGIVGKGAQLVHCGTCRNVVIGDNAVLNGIARAEDATILSCPEHPTFVGAGVQLHKVIVGEGAHIDTGAILDKAYVGQAAKIGKQFSAENSLFFANCEGFHGEAVAVFAGPYTVTHHKSTLLIAAQFSFYNAGSGTNQSNHMYKLGPVHQGVFERGCKTGSFSYVLHETHVGAFSVIIGKHYANIDTGSFPFSNIHESEGQSRIVPGINLFAVGTVRDGEKWPKRDGRKCPTKRDRISFDVYSPFTVEKMRRGRDELNELQRTTPKDQTVVKIGGLTMKRFFLRKSAKFYQQAVTRYALGKVLQRLYAALDNGSSWEDAVGTLRSASVLKDATEWVDVSGQLLPRETLVEIENGITSGSLATMAAVQKAFAQAGESYGEYEWEYVYELFGQERGFAPDAMTRENAGELLDEYAETANAMLGMVLDDSKKEYAAFARIGYGIGMEGDDILRDFESVRGTAEKNSVVAKLTKEKGAIETWVAKVREAVERA